MFGMMKMLPILLIIGGAGYGYHVIVVKEKDNRINQQQMDIAAATQQNVALQTAAQTNMNTIKNMEKQMKAQAQAFASLTKKASALEMEKKLAIMRSEWANDSDWPELVHNIRHRVGLNSGEMVTGNMGSSMRMNYTMMGDTVNLAARLEASAKQYGVYIQVAEETYNACKDKFIWRDLDYVIVMGKTEPAQVFELIAEVDKMPPGYDKLLPAYDKAIKLYRNQEWEKAIEAFMTSDKLEDMFPGRKTNPSRIYIPRCEHYRDNPPGDDWDGSWALTKK